jgi:hypothetical protein
MLGHYAILSHLMAKGKLRILEVTTKGLFQLFSFQIFHWIDWLRHLYLARYIQTFYLMGDNFLIEGLIQVGTKFRRQVAVAPSV